jgi:serine/threonine-protein kinase
MTAPQQQLGSFLIGEKIGSGAMGIVYRATHVKTGVVAAVKVITVPEDGQVVRANAGDRFDREYEILRQFRHPGIVRWLAAGRSKGTRYFAMEYVEGQTIEQLVLEQQAIDWLRVLDLGVQVCDALQYAHDRGVVHRDMKPSNLMITSSGQVKLTDFGIAKDLDATALTAPGRTLGTAAYMAPEQIRGSTQVSHKIDIYALGCVLYQMLTGELPFKGNNVGALMNGHLNQPPPRPSEKAPQIPRALDDLILKMMAKDPTQRPWDAAAVGHELRELQGKVARGEPIKIVFGPPYVSEAAVESVSTQEQPTAVKPPPQALTSGTAGPKTSGPGTTATATPRKRKKKGSKKEWRPSATGIGMAAAAAGLLALIIWQLLPASADQLYGRAAPLMASDDPIKWQDADRMYLSEFERRFPNDPRVAEIQPLRDKILLDKTRRRARMLTTLGRPQNEVEDAYVKARKRAEDAEKSGFENIAAEAWSALASAYSAALKQASAEDAAAIKGWQLLAQDNAAAMTATVEKRTSAAEKLLLEAKTAEANGQDGFGREQRKRLLREFRAYPYLGHILEAARTGLPDEPQAEEVDTEASPAP